MTTWVDKSDSKSRFLDGGENEGQSATDSLADLCDCLINEIIGRDNTDAIDLLLLEVNCDTGRLLAAATTAENHSRGMVDECSLRVQEIQDFWYDLLESGPTDEEFTSGVTERIRELGIAFRGVLLPHVEELRRSCSPEGFKFIVFGSDPGKSIYEEEFRTI